ncbi:MAG TPA: DNA methyltransferase, partial [Pirellulales bacterium]|nr:DNA methyltransferase [Pirellulales bacterium]
SFEHDEHYLAWIGKYAEQWRRILKPNGSLFCFCDSSMASRLDVLLSSRFNMLSHIVWTKPNEPGYDGWKGKMKKEALRQWYPLSERILFAEPAIEGNIFRSPFGKFLMDARKQAGMSMKELTGVIGAHGAVNHGGAVSNWEAGRNTPSRDQYEKMREALIGTGKVKSMPDYEDAIRVFTIDASKQFTDVWTFQSVKQRQGKHPAEKPLDLLEHAIAATTFAGDIVLDCFAGSGNTALAAIRLGRRAVAIEIEHRWVSKIVGGVQRHFAESLQPSINGNGHASALRRIDPQLQLFGGG